MGSGGTTAGLVHALAPQRVLGVHCGAVSDPAGAVATLTSELSGASLAPDSLRLRLRPDQVGESYGTLAGPVLAAMNRAARTEGIALDPVYTGRAVAGLIAAVADGDITPGRRTVFLHTGACPACSAAPTHSRRPRRTWPRGASLPGGTCADQAVSPQEATHARSPRVQGPPTSDGKLRTCT
ncbi:pyridoxal-phosphate dependent enzyme [Streptomyces sp. NPDC006658]|uniref:pyridoxal-phosphate dependent enzyme n=1 Tax=Streptomyces sp. NPDC006658 TaxID=3156900 RepID=UPI0033E26473